MQKEKIIFLTGKNPRSKRDWSGIPYFMFQALQDIYDVEYVAGPKLTLLRRMLYYLGIALEKVNGSKFIFDYGGITARAYGRYYSRLLVGKTNAKFIFVPAGLTEISHLETEIPLVAAGDCSTLQLFEYYPALKGVSEHSRRDVERVERSALVKCSKVVFSSAWASEFVRSHFGVQADVIPFGANIQAHVSPARERLKNTCSLLIVGVDWRRKGGNTALEIHRMLVDQKIECSLTVVGMKPETNEELSSNINFTFIDKDSDAGERQFMELLHNSDFLLLPTVADCTPIVIAEAFAAGLPVLATRTGGIPSMVVEGVTGFLFESGDSKSYADCIRDLLGEPETMERLSRNCLTASRTTFNWRQWAVGIQKLCAAL